VPLSTRHRTPAVLAACALGAGAGFAALLRIHSATHICAAIVAAFLLAVPSTVNLVDAFRGRPPRRSRLACLLLLISLLLTGTAWHAVRHELVEAGDIALVPRGSAVALEANVLETRAGGDRVRLLASIRSVQEGKDTRRAGGRVWTWWPPDEPPPTRGDIVLLRGSLEAPKERRNPGGFDFSSYLRRRGVFVVLRTRDAEIVRRSRGCGRAGRWIEQAIEESLAGQSGSLLTGLLLGRSGDLHDETREAFRRAGTVHVLAVSGLHVGFVVLIALALLRSMRVPPRIARLLVLPALLAFVLVVGPRPSVVRAATMATVLLVSTVLERRSPSANALGTAAFVLIAARPGSICDLGFLLSFGATAGILVLFEPLRRIVGGPLRRFGRIGGWLGDSVALSTSAQCGVAPVLIAQMGELSLVAPLANLLVVPLAAWSVASGYALLAARAIARPLSGTLAGSAWAALEAMRGVTAAISATPWATATIASRFWPASLLTVAAAAVRLRGRGRRAAGWAGALGLAALLATALAAWGPGRRDPRIVFFDVGQGDAALIEIPGRGRVLIDAGPEGSGERVILPFFRREGIRGIEVLVVTHAHADHYGGAAEVLRGASVRALALPPGRTLHGSLAATIATAREAGVRVREVADGDTLLAGAGVSLVVVGPRDDRGLATLSENDVSVVAVARFGAGRALLTGDIEGPAEDMLLSGSRALAAEVLKVPHHGSATSTTGRFLEAVSPAIAVVSVGEGNRFGHPDRSVLARLREARISVFRTDADGAIVAAFGRRVVARSIASGRVAVVELQMDNDGSAGPTATTLIPSRSIRDSAAAWTSCGRIDASRLAYESSLSRPSP